MGWAARGCFPSRSPRFAIVVVIGTFWLMARTITTRVSQIRRLLNTVADGDFGQRLTTRSRDELGEMAQALNRTVDRIGER